MKKNPLILLSCLLFIIIACGNKKEAAVLTINGSIEGYDTDNIYLYKVENQFFDFVELLDSVAVADGKFTYTNDTLQTRLYFISTQSNLQDEKAFAQGSYLFLKKGDNELQVYENDQNKMQVESDFALQSQLVEFAAQKELVGNRRLIDSLDQLFFAARAAGNEKEMARIKEESMPYYEESTQKTNDWLNNRIAKNKKTLFGLYLYYTYNFQNSSFSTLDEVAEVRKRLQDADEEAKQSVYFAEIEQKLAVIENCAVGHAAPEIVGLDSLDNEVKLSDFRGKYVLVDFWSSGCSWCRKETPNFRKTHEEFKDKNLVVLGVSSDLKKEDWLNAIHEDKSYWNHIIMRRADMKRIMDSYAIIGIPEILLVDPQGVILAKGLRGDDIYNTVAQHVK